MKILSEQAKAAKRQLGRDLAKIQKVRAGLPYLSDERKALLMKTVHAQFPEYADSQTAEQLFERIEQMFRDKQQALKERYNF
jgi:hypothetical protein